MEVSKTTRLEWCLGSLLTFFTFLIFLPVRGFDFIYYDDPWYVESNPHVRDGFSWDGIVWAFTKLTGDGQTYWHPVTWLSHMLDGQLFKSDPGWIHLTNVAFHAINVLILFHLLVRITRAVWKSAMVAVVFAWHPLSRLARLRGSLSAKHPWNTLRASGYRGLCFLQFV